MLGLLPALQGRVHVRGQLGLTYAEQTQLGDGRCTQLSDVAPVTVASGVGNPYVNPFVRGLRPPWWLRFSSKTQLWWPAILTGFRHPRQRFPFISELACKKGVEYHSAPLQRARLVLGLRVFHLPLGERVLRRWHGLSCHGVMHLSTASIVATLSFWRRSTYML